MTAADRDNAFTHVRQIPASGREVRVAWSPDGSLLAVSTDRVIRLWDHGSGTQTLAIETDDDIRRMSFAPDGEALASAGYQPEFAQGGVIRFWDSRSGRLLASHVTSLVECIAFAPDGRALASGGEGVQLWDVDRDRIHLRADITDAQFARDLAFSPGGTALVTATDSVIHLWDVANGGALTRTLGEEEDRVDTVAFHPSGRFVAADDGYRSIKVWTADDGNLVTTLEGHTNGVFRGAFVGGGRLLATHASDDTVRFWNVETWACVGVLPVPPSTDSVQAAAFHPSLPRLAVVTYPDIDGANATVGVWEYDADVLLGREQPTGHTYTTAKIVLVGESGVGKTGLGWRLAHGAFKEHPSTHGQQFWLVDELGATRTDGAQCEAILWDLAGQPDYRLIHALFLDDADLALVLFDPTRDDAPLRGVEYWLRQLGLHNGRLRRPVILVAARSDRGTSRLAPEEVELFCAQTGVQGCVTTSAFTGEGLPGLVERMRDAIAWDRRPTTVTTETFKRIKDYVLGLKEQGRPDQVILTPAELRHRLVADRAVTEFTDAEMLTAVGHLSNHGYVSRLRTSQGEERILLAPELLNNLASSMVLEARRNPKGLGSIEERRLLAGDCHFPELDGLSLDEREVLLDSAVARFIDHKVCFRETDPLNSQVYLVFPELINLRKPTVDDGQKVEETVAYTVCGAVENVYASLVVLLGYTSTFNRANQWHNQARYVVGDGLICGFRLEDEREGELDFVLYFSSSVGATVRGLFQGLFESFLARRDLAVDRYEQVTCPNGHRLNRAVVREHLADGDERIFCTRCGEPVSLPRANAPIELSRVQAEDLDTQRRVAAQRSRFEEALFRLKAYVTQEQISVPECFVSYAWGDADQERWVEHELATDLVKAGITVVLDRWENARIGSSVPRFVERVQKADRVIVVGTPRYRAKYDNDEPMRGYVVDAEGDLIGVRMIGSKACKETVLPVLLEGTPESSLPPLLQGRVYADFREPEAYFVRVFDLILSLYQIPPQRAAAAGLRDLLGS
ncbi:TIR domain-containing protein [Phytohabitans rumicis]|uniref:TIR domain-containing protein n=1 Tax=Phytohabitans rumicis TaxID=1076125 RepID=UPI0015650A56|nr:TIR domain-containing protein [Phytohabitans rumicis]